jgi:hypothetical protein
MHNGIYLGRAETLKYKKMIEEVYIIIKTNYKKIPNK